MGRETVWVARAAIPFQESVAILIDDLLRLCKVEENDRYCFGRNHWQRVSHDDVHITGTHVIMYDACAVDSI